MSNKSIDIAKKKCLQSFNGNNRSIILWVMYEKSYEEIDIRFHLVDYAYRYLVTHTKKCDIIIIIMMEETERKRCWASVSHWAWCDDAYLLACRMVLLFVYYPKSPNHTSELADRSMQHAHWSMEYNWGLTQSVLTWNAWYHLIDTWLIVEKRLRGFKGFGRI